jgi:phosphonate transport system substrate-binding protein
MRSWWSTSRRRAVRDLVALLALTAAVPSVAADRTESAARESLRLGVVGFYNPRLMVLRYQPLADYLTTATGRRWELVVGTTYDRTVDSLCHGELDLAYLGPYTYVRANALCGAQAVARLRTRGKDTYRSVIMVRMDSAIRSLADLRGARMGFGELLSTSSHLVPLAMLMDAGIRNDAYSCRLYGHHEHAARAVLLGEVDACAVRDVVGDRFEERGLRVIATSPPIPNFPFAMPADANPQLRREVVDALVTRPRRDLAARAAIEALDEELADGFAECEDADFDGLRELARQVFGPDALVASEDDLRARSGCDGP